MRLVLVERRDYCVLFDFLLRPQMVCQWVTGTHIEGS